MVGSTERETRLRTQSEHGQKLEERRRPLRAQLCRAKAVEAEQARKLDAWRRMVVGAMVLGLVECGESPRERLLEQFAST